MVGWHHQLNGHEFEQAPGVVGDGQGSLASTVHGVTKSWAWLSDWTELIALSSFFCCVWPVYHYSLLSTFLCPHLLSTCLIGTDMWYFLSREFSPFILVMIDICIFVISYFYLLFDLLSFWIKNSSLVWFFSYFTLY